MAQTPPKSQIPSDQSTVSRFHRMRSAFLGWLPASVDGRVRTAAWWSLATQVLIVGTGGAVRLTGSGLGCSTWPQCTEDSWVPTPEMEIHGLIEFGNRLLTFVLGAVAVIMLILVWKLRHSRPGLFRLALILLIGIPAQGVVGGITVLTQLNPYVVGFHFVVSAVLVALAAWQLDQVLRGPGPFPVRSSLPLRGASWLVLGLISVTVVAGIVATGAGPHAGDEHVPRNGLDPELLYHLHSYPAYAAAALLLLALAAALWQRDRIAAWFGIVLLGMAAQMTLGIAQTRLGLPEVMVGAHMLLAVVLVALSTTLVLRAKGAAARASA